MSGSTGEPHAVGLDLGGTAIKGVAATVGGRVLATDEVPTADVGDESWKPNVRRLLEKLEASVGRPASWVGLSAPGLVARDGLSIEYMPGRLRGLENFHWGSFLRDEELVVPVLNDAHAALAGEAWTGAARGLENAFLLTLGTGVGGAILADGRILRGHIGRAGHLGHVTVDYRGEPDVVLTPGSLEEAIGNKSIRERTGGRFPTTHDLVAAAREGDERARELWDDSVRALAAALASLINVLDPEAIIIGGGIARAGRELFDPLEAYLDQMEWRPGGHSVRLLPARLGERAGALGAASRAMRHAGVLPECDPEN